MGLQALFEEECPVFACREGAFQFDDEDPLGTASDTTTHCGGGIGCYSRDSGSSDGFCRGSAPEISVIRGCSLRRWIHVLIKKALPGEGATATRSGRGDARTAADGLWSDDYAPNGASAPSHSIHTV